ncbi:MAG TPA: hypothetical protein PLC79_01440, partial [Phycisphaerae bacterium]|nr:hypothetical protein [Phycisphaerae bacterium]
MMRALPGSQFPERGRPTPDAGGLVTVQIVSRVDVAADVTVRLLVEGLVVHLTQMRVAPHSETNVVGPDGATTIEIDGTFATGRPIRPAVLLFGRDFGDGDTEIYYLEAPEDSNVPPVVSALEPAGNIQVVRGGVLHVSWEDEDPDDNATIVAYLDRNNLALDGDEVALSAPLAEDPDGEGYDDVSVVIPQATQPGVYYVLLVISDGHSLGTAYAPGTVTVLGEENDRPELTILEPKDTVTIEPGASLFVKWTDRDDDDSALLRFSLVPTGEALDGGHAIRLGDSLPEDPDGEADQALLPTSGVVPGIYDLYGVIDDGTTSATAKAPGRVIIATRGGSAPSPNPPVNVLVSPDRGGYNEELTVIIIGLPVEAGNTYVRLTAPGQSDIVGTNVCVASDGLGLTFDLSLDRAAAGPRTIVVSTESLGTTSIVGGFRVMQPGDLDSDGDVEQDDFERFMACFNGPN